MFFAGETISHIFTIPFLPEEVSRILVTYKQNNRIVLVKSITSEAIETVDGESTFAVTLSQKESLLFKTNEFVKIQLNVYTTTAARCVSEELTTFIGVQHVNEVIDANSEIPINFATPITNSEIDRLF